jgi:sialate O-acetylesterase
MLLTILVLNITVINNGLYSSKVNNTWSVILDVISEGQICEVQISQEGQTDLVIKDILFGDIWVCSGQSNMEFAFKIFNADKEIKALASFDKIR